jgi:hypothetical protein
MKKIILSVVLAITVFAAGAQTKVTKTSIVSKWSLTAMSVDSVLYYDMEKDSISLSKTTLEKILASGQDSATLIDQMKAGLGALKEMVFSFNADGSYSADGGQENDKGTYTVNEATETISLVTKKEGTQEIKASFKNGRLLLNMPTQGGPATIMEFKKEKK